MANGNGIAESFEQKLWQAADKLRKNKRLTTNRELGLG